MRDQVLSVSILAFWLPSIVSCLPGRHPLAIRQCHDEVNGIACSEASSIYALSTTSTTSGIKPTITPILAARSEDHVGDLTATCGDDICSIWDVSSSIVAVITGPGYNSTESKSVPLTTGGGSATGSSSQRSNAPFANETSTSNTPSMPTATGVSGTRINGTVLSSLSTSLSSSLANNTSVNSSSSATNADLTTALSSTGTNNGGTTGFAPSSTTGTISTNNTSPTQTSLRPGNTSVLASSSTTRAIGTNTTVLVSTKGTAVSSGLPVPSATTDAVWTNSTTYHVTSGWPSNSTNATSSRPSASLTYWDPWSAWTESSGVAATGTAHPTYLNATSCSESEFISYATTYVYTFSGTSYTIPIPASHITLHSSTDSNSASAPYNVAATSASVETNLSASATNSSIPAATSSVVSPFAVVLSELPVAANTVSASVSTSASASISAADASVTDSNSAATDPTSYSSCFTTTPTHQLESATPSPSPTIVCWGFSCINSSCSDWLSRTPVTAVDAASSSGVPFINTTDSTTSAPYSTASGTGPSDYYPTDSGNPTTTTTTKTVGTITRTVYPVAASSLGPWVDWSSAFATSSLSYTANDTDATATSVAGPGTVTVRFSMTGTGTGGFVSPTIHIGEYYNGVGRLRQGTPEHMRDVLRKRRAANEEKVEVDEARKHQEARGLTGLVRRFFG